MIYLKTKKYVRVKFLKIRVDDVAEVCCRDKMLEDQVRAVVVKVCDSKESNTKIVLSLLEIIRAIYHKNFGEIEILTMGAQDILIDLDIDMQKHTQRYPNDHNRKNRIKHMEKNKWIEYCKVVMVTLITFFGSVVAVMTYNEDVQVNGVFQKIIESMGGNTEDMQWMALAYGVGIAVGVILFFNHFGRKKFDDDPTPMEVEMSKYETDLINTRLNAKNQKQEK